MNKNVGLNQGSNIKDQSQAQRSKMEVRYRAFYLFIDVIRFLEALPQTRRSLRILSDQMMRAVTSMGANIVEAKASSSKREFANYFQIALKSTNETKYWLAMMRELVPEDREQLNKFLQEADEIGKILATSVLTMKGKRGL